MAITCTKRPLWWYIGSGVTLAIGLVLLILGILAKTTGTTQLYSGLASAPYIENTYEMSGCSNLFLGDSTCAGARFQGWSMTSKDKYDTCMLESSPSSKALASAAKWCQDGVGGCSKPGSCKPGMKYIYSFFSVLNPDEILKGVPAEVREMEPIYMLKKSDRVHVDKALWDKEGVAKWSETVEWELVNSSADAGLLDQVIVVPNPGAFMSFSPSFMGGSSRVSYESFAFTVAAGRFYAGLQAKVNDMAAKYMPGMDLIFNGASAINWRTLVRDAYWNGSPILTMGRVFANKDICRFLMQIITGSQLLQGNPDFFVAMMCTDAYVGNVALDGYAKVFELMGMRFTPSDAIFFYSFEKGCATKCEKPSYLCYQSAICPPGSPPDCLDPSLSEADAVALFSLFDAIHADPDFANSTGTLGQIGQFLEDCTIGTHQLSPPSKCALVQEQLRRAGRAAMFKANPEGKQVAANYGWQDLSVAADMIPYFINGTVGEVMNYTGAGGLANGLKMWSTVSEVNRDLFTKQQMSSKFGHQGINYFSSAMGLNQSCAFDHGCMAQSSFLADGKTCVASDTCTPTQASGYDVGAVPGYVFGSEFGTSEFHGLGKNKTMFVSDLFLQATFTQVATDAVWSTGVVVDKWNISAVSMRSENCHDANPQNRGLDCHSPLGTINVGHNTMYLGGKTPLVGWLPIYMSFPYFGMVVPDNQRSAAAYNPTDASKLIFHACASCGAASKRDFNTYLWTDPQTGLHLSGNQRLQFNVRIHANPASISLNPAKADETALVAPSVFLDPQVDVTVPVYWINKFDQAAPYQLDQIAFVQAAPHLLNVVFWVGLCLGLLFLGAGAVMLWHGIRLRRKNNQILIIPDYCKEEARSEETNPDKVYQEEAMTVGKV